MDRWFSIQVDSTKWPTFPEYQALFHGVSSQLDGRINVSQLHPALRGITPPLGRIDVLSAVIDPSRMVSSNDVVQWGRSQAMRPVFPWEYYAFVARHLESMRDVRTVCLGFHYRQQGSMFFHRAKHFVPHAYQIGQDLCLDSAEYERFWLNGTRFLFARE